MTTQEQHQLGVNLYEKGQYQQAGEVFAELLNAGESSEVWNDWASAQASAGRLTEAKRGFERALQLDPRNREAVGNLAVLVRYDLPKQSASFALPEGISSSKAMTPEMKRNWDFVDKRQLLYALIGYDFGMEPETRLDEIREYKRKESQFLVNALQLNSKDIVFDLGSGCGFIARVTAPLCQKLYCLDISREFLRFAKEELQDLSNVEFHRMEYGDLHYLADKQITKGYANAVFIHFNLFDIVLYLREVHRILKSGGIFLFGTNNSDSLDIQRDRYFRIVLQHYVRERTSPTLMQWNSAHSVCSIASQIGFVAQELWSGNGTAMVLLRKL
jgi:ubiquinone/menaquinone biosynthesis C-methylase UbiE